MKRCLVVMVFAWACGVGATQASAQSCFDLPDTRSEGARSSARKITLGARVITKANCEYALTPDAAWVALPALDSDFAGVIDALATQTRTAMTTRPTTIYARAKQPKKTGTQVSIESIFLAGCSEYLLSEAHGFSLRVPVDTQRPTITREPNTAICGAEQLGLHVVPVARSADAPLLQRGPFVASLAVGTAELALDPGAYAIYAARTPDSVGYLVGRVATESSLTPLRAALNAAEQGTSRPWLRVAWNAGRMQLEAVSDALVRSDAWSELRTAAAANAAWLQRRDHKLGKLGMSEDGSSIFLPADDIGQRMKERYGNAAQHMAPDLGEWKDITAGVDLCVANRYALPQGSVAQNVGAKCVSMSRLLSPMSVHGGVAIGSGQVCVQDHVRVMTAAGTKDGAAHPERCASLQVATETEIDAPPFLLVTRGAQLRFDGQGRDHLFACLDNECIALPQADATLPLSKSGLLEIRHADTVDHARSAQALTRLRVGVIDPEREWHPVGLFTGKPTNDPNSAWHSLLHDADHVFTYARRRQHLDFRLSVSPTLAAAWNAARNQAHAATQLTQDLPVFGAVNGTLEGAKRPTLATLVTRDGTCPEQTAAEVAAQPVIDPERLLPDQELYVHLAQYVGEDAPLRCLARARLRIVDSRSLRATDQIRVGLLGDVQLMVFVTRPAAIGLSLPLVYGFWRWGYGLGLDGSISLATAVTFDPSQVSRAGLMASTALVWGPETLAPRLLSFGVALHAATGTHEDSPYGSVYLGLNLSSLLDVAGGR